MLCRQPTRVGGTPISEAAEVVTDVNDRTPTAFSSFSRLGCG